MRGKLLFLLPLFVFFLIGCGENGSGVTKTFKLPVPSGTPETIVEDVESVDYGDTIVYHLDSDALSLNPLLCDDIYSREIVRWIFNGLVTPDEHLKLKPDLAETFEVAADGKSATFHLRKGVKWHDGEEFTAEDVVFTYQTIIDPGTRSRLRFDFSMIDTIETADKYTLTVKYSKPYADALNIWANCIVSRHAFENKGLDPNLQPVGTGPYRFVEWLPHDHLLLEANKDYFRGRPFVDHYMFKYMADFTQAFQMLKRGELDLMFLTADQYLKQASDREFMNRFTIYLYNSYYTIVSYNLRNPLFQSSKVRKALTMAMDRQSIVDEVFKGYAYVPARPFVPPYLKFEKKLDSWPYSPSTAKILFESEGWRDTDGDGILDKNGQKFEFDMIAVHGNKNRELASQIIEKSLKDNGVLAHIHFIELGEFMRSLYIGQFSGLLVGLMLSDDPYQYFHSSQIFDLKTGNTGLNLIAYHNPEVDELLDRIRTELDPAARMNLLQRFHEIIQEDQPGTFLYSDMTILAVSKRIRGIKSAPDWIFHDLESWYVPKKLQKYGEITH
ncbi:MAG: peptide-binding protein [Candidatus Wallbacteria bacterium]|nr:peptide-binding protein [Candidatus Wallbacteria bacterium]